MYEIEVLLCRGSFSESAKTIEKCVDKVVKFMVKQGWFVEDIEDLDVWMGKSLDELVSLDCDITQQISKHKSYGSARHCKNRMELLHRERKELIHDFYSTMAKLNKDEGAVKSVMERKR